MSEKSEADKCPIHLLCPYDTPTRFSNLSWRAFLTLINWSILGVGLTKTNFNIFISILLLSTPLWTEYAGFKPSILYRRILREISLYYHLLLSTIGLFGVFGILSTISRDDKTYIFIDKWPILDNIKFDIVHLWGFTSLSFIIAFVDYIVYESDFEKDVIKDKLNAKERFESGGN